MTPGRNESRVFYPDFTPLERLLNRQIEASTPARELCRRLDGKVLAMHLRNTGLNIYLAAHSAGVNLAFDCDQEPDTVLTGTPFGFAAMATAEPEAPLRSGAVRIEGDAEVAELFRHLLRHAQPDWEEELSRLIGDVAAHQVGNIVRRTTEWARHAAETLTRDAAEFLQEESRDLPARGEVEEFMAQVDELVSDADRLDAHVQRLEAGLGRG